MGLLHDLSQRRILRNELEQAGDLVANIDGQRTWKVPTMLHFVRVVSTEARGR